MPFPMRIMKQQRRAWTTIRRVIVLCAVLVIARPGTAGMVSLDALAATTGPARELVQAILRMCGEEDAARQSLRADLDQALSLAEMAQAQSQDAEAAIAREAPFRQLDSAWHSTFEPRPAAERRYTSPGNPAISDAARSLRAAL